MSTSTMNSSAGATAQSKRFSARRFLLMLRHYAFVHRKSWIIGLLVITLVPITIMLLIVIFAPDPTIFMNNQNNSSWLQLYIFAGLLLTSSIFADIHKPGKSWLALTLPASPGEKYWSAWLISGPIYTIAAMLVILGLSIISALIRTMFGIDFSLFNPFTHEVLQQILLFLLLHALFLWGAVWWDKMSFLYTLLALVAIAGMALLITYIGVISIEFFLPESYIIDVGNLTYERGMEIATGWLWLFSWLFFLFWGADCYARKERLS